MRVNHTVAFSQTPGLSHRLLWPRSGSVHEGGQLVVLEVTELVHGKIESVKSLNV